jgi:hypothetical protein
MKRKGSAMLFRNYLLASLFLVSFFQLAHWSWQPRKHYFSRFKEQIYYMDGSGQNWIFLEDTSGNDTKPVCVRFNDTDVEIPSPVKYGKVFNVFRPAKHFGHASAASLDFLVGLDGMVVTNLYSDWGKTKRDMLLPKPKNYAKIGDQKTDATGKGHVG